MKKLLLSLTALCSSCMMFSQITLLDENFDNFPNFVISGFGNWQTLDLDQLNTYTGGDAVTNPVTPSTLDWPNIGTKMAFQIFNPSAAGVTNNSTVTPADLELRNFDPHSGLKFAASWAGVPAGLTNTNNDWLISPPIQLGGAGNALSFWVKSLSQTIGAEKYRVGIYVGSGSPTSAASFTIISGAATQSATFAWVQKNYPLDAYSNQVVRIGIQNAGSDLYMLMVDDVKITAATLGTDETGSKKDYAVFPNPTKGTFTVKSDDKITGIRVYDASGKLVSENRNSNKGDITGKPAGVYYLNIAFGDGVIKTEKLIKE